MKALILGVAVALTSIAFAIETQDVSQILDDNHCVPVHKKDGRITAFECEGTLGQMASAELNSEHAAGSAADANESLSLDGAASSKLKMKVALSVNGKIVAQPQIITDLNQSATITQKEKKSNKEYVIEVLPTTPNSANPEMVQMQFKVTQIEKGQSKILSGASILGKTNQQAEVSVNMNNPKDQVKTVSIKVTPTWVESQTF